MITLLQFCGMQAVVTAVVVLLTNAADGGSGGTGGANPANDCIVDVKDVAASSKCLRSGFCGPVECCYAEAIIPPHDELVPGNRRIVSSTPVDGQLVLRKCDPPVYFFGFLFGRYECESERTLRLDGYFRYQLAACPVGDDAQSGTGD
jgi:hypothetical protein